jgi:hypothetical protein
MNAIKKGTKFQTNVPPVFTDKEIYKALNFIRTKNNARTTLRLYLDTECIDTRIENELLTLGCM